MIELRQVNLIVALGAHPDDIEIGAGGTLIRLARRHPSAEFSFIVMTGSEERIAEARQSATQLLDGRARVTTLGATDGSLPYADPAGAKAWLRSVSGEPDLVFAPWRGDAHQDHRFVSELAWQIYRGRLILEYPIAKWESESFTANVLFPLTPEEAEAKVGHLIRAFPSQHEKVWYRESVFWAALATFGIQAQTAFAEGFVGRKVVLE